MGVDTRNMISKSLIKSKLADGSVRERKHSPRQEFFRRADNKENTLYPPILHIHQFCTSPYSARNVTVLVPQLAFYSYLLIGLLRQDRIITMTFLD